MTRENSRDRLFLTTMLAGLALSVVPAMAQTQTAPDDAKPAAKADEDVIIVTGSRIPQANLTTTSPVTQVTGEDITTQGVTRVEDLTNQLPQVFAGQGSAISNGASGTATVNLRGLGASRTLVLVNGHRMGYGSPNSVASDLNQIPGSVVDRVEVLTGGASAVYGSDAVSGVVNFIMKKDFEGFRVDGQYGFYSHSNESDNGYIRDVIKARNATNPSQFKLPSDDVNVGYSKEATVMFGVSSPDKRGNITAYASYRQNDAVLQSNYDYSACSLAAPSTAAVAGVPTGASHWTCGGSSTSFPGRFFLATGSKTIDYAQGKFVPFTTANQYNFGPLNYYQRPDTRYSFGSFGHYEINEHAEVYADMMFSDYRSVSQIAPSGDFFNTTTINCDNPLLTASMKTDICGAAANTSAVRTLYVARRNVEGGGRQDNLNFTSYRMTGGVRGAVNDNWQYDVSGSYSRVALARVYQNDFSVTRLKRALDVVDVGGTPTCRSVVDGSDPNCVPWDIFHQNGVTKAALNYLQIPLIQKGETIERDFQATITGDTGFKSPGAETTIALSLGIEARRDEIASTTDAAFASGDGAGQGGPTIGLTGSTDVVEVFGEARVPILEDKPFAKLLAVDGAYRYSSYDSGVTAETYKAGGEWSPVEDIRFRASYSHAVRAANVIELFAAQGAGLFDLGNDPCNSQAQPSGYVVPASCIGTNPWQVTTAQRDSGDLQSTAGQYNGLFGGNPQLSPEEADTTTLGFVFSPSFVPRLHVSVDYFSIEVDNVVGTLPATTVLNDCYQGGTHCDLIHRNPNNGKLWGGPAGFVTLTNVNTDDSLKTSGYDINADWSHDIGSFGKLTFALTGTYLDELDPGIGSDCVGLFAGNGKCGTPNPQWRHRFRVGWQTPWDLDLNATWRYYDEVKYETGATGLGTTFDAQNYIDLSGNYQLRENAKLRFGINNFFDNDPPIANTVGAGSGNGNTFPQVYDALGRYLFAGITLDF